MAGLKTTSVMMLGVIGSIVLYAAIAMATDYPTKVKEILGVLKKEGRKATDKELTTVLMAVYTSDAFIRDMDMDLELIRASGRDPTDPVVERLEAKAYAKAFPNEDRRRKVSYLKIHTRLDPKIREAIASGLILIGMKAEDVVASWGGPYQNNKTTTPFGVHEQWVYPPARTGVRDRYLYFDNGILTSYQTSE